MTTLGIKLMDENLQVYFDLEEKIPAADLKRYERAINEDKARLLSKRLDEIEEEIGDIDHP
jgi:hypothetical protein